MRVESLPPEQLATLVDALADIRHDLGKYICFEQRFLAADASLEQRRAALRADVGSTRRRGDEVETAMALWARLRPAVLDGDPDVQTIDAQMLRLTADWEAADSEGLQRAQQAAQAIAQATRSLHRRAQDGLLESEDG